MWMMFFYSWWCLLASGSVMSMMFLHSWWCLLASGSVMWRALSCLSGWGPLLAGLEVLDVAVHFWTVREIALRRIECFH